MPMTFRKCEEMRKKMSAKFRKCLLFSWSLLNWAFLAKVKKPPILHSGHNFKFVLSIDNEVLNRVTCAWERAWCLEGECPVSRTTCLNWSFWVLYESSPDIIMWKDNSRRYVLRRSDLRCSSSFIWIQPQVMFSAKESLWAKLAQPEQTKRWPNNFNAYDEKFGSMSSSNWVHLVFQSTLVPLEWSRRMHYAGLWRRKDDQDPVCVKLCTGLGIFLANCLLIWQSKLQGKVALSTMESEYIAPSAGIHSLLPLKSLVEEVVS